MFHSVSLLSQALVVRGSRALPSILFSFSIDFIFYWGDKLWIHVVMPLSDCKFDFYILTGVAQGGVAIQPMVSNAQQRSHLQ